MLKRAFLMRTVYLLITYSKSDLEARAENEWKNLAPNIIRQRLMMEAITERIVEPPQIKDYLIRLAEIFLLKVSML